MPVNALPSKPCPEYRARDAILRALGFADYSSYLNSNLWQTIRKAVVALKGHYCLTCRGLFASIHHLSYTKESLTGEDLSALVPVCDRCHFKIEFRSKKVRRKRVYQKRTVAEARIQYDNLVRNYGRRRQKRGEE